jgi:hypothetical protein
MGIVIYLKIIGILWAIVSESHRLIVDVKSEKV